MRGFALLVFLLFAVVSAFAQQKFTISGTVRDAKTGEELISSTIQVKELANTGVASNAYGFYSFTLPKGNYTLLCRYTGYTEFRQEISLDSNIVLNINLAPAIVEIKQVEISATREDRNVKEAQMGVTHLDIKQLEKIPVIFGERDILKTIQLLPGVKAAAEGSSGFYVRGGGADQNLVLLDEALVYNASHLLGFFSTFNNDAIKSATLYKGNMPAEYGGKLSSVLDLKMKEGNDKTYHIGGGIGLIASRLYAEGPIVKDKGSFIGTFRRTYADVFLKAFKDTTINKVILHFYDINAKANYRVSKRDRIFISGYFGRDKLALGNQFGIDYGNATATARWNHIASEKLFSNLSFIYNNFQWKVTVNYNGLNVSVNSVVQDFSLKEDLEYFINANHKIKMGGQSTFRSNIPGDINSNTPNLINPFKVTHVYGWENAVYAQHEATFWGKVNINYGVRLSTFTVTGPGKNYYFYPNHTDTVNLKVGQFAKTFFNPEPRFSLSYNFVKDMSFKAAYSRNTQNIHLLSNTTTSTPADRWIMTSNNIKPEIADQVSAGYFFNFYNNMFEFSIEGYYKWMQNQIDYKNGAQLVINETVENQLVYGVGRAYGGEIFLKKRLGKFTGWISYTLSRTERRYKEVDNNAWFPARYDRTHDVAIVLMYDITPRINVAATWVYSTGNAVTYASGKYPLNGTWIPYYGPRNSDRFPAYHRMDIGATFVLKKRKWLEHDLNISVYNLYARQNPYQINFNANDVFTHQSTTEQVSLFKIVPSVTYNFKFNIEPKKKRK
jgi:hypothetical protein